MIVEYGVQGANGLWLPDQGIPINCLTIHIALHRVPRVAYERALTKEWSL